MNEQNYFGGKIHDLIRREAHGEEMVFSSFLTAEEGETAASICKNAGAPYLLYGGFDHAERKMLGVSSMEHTLLKPCFPIAMLSIEAYRPELISNRDILGAVMATGVRRDCLGDIVARKGVLLMVVAAHIAPFLIENLSKIGNQHVRLNEVYGEIHVPEPEYQSLRLTVASMRLDAVVAALAKISRDQACQMIEAGSISVNHIPVVKKTKEIFGGDRVVIRGKGKWILDSCDGTTKKGRIVLECKKYI
ncbi:MAG: hypothetical protein IJN80_07090 [Clostridia bacterium]|nr:hypothetical protein [Clostridia bacterium]